MSKTFEIEDYLFQGLRNNDENCFREIYRLSASSLLIYANKLIGNNELAEDCLQILFIKLFKNKHKLESAEHLRFWFYRVMGNICKNYYRHKMRYYNTLENYKKNINFGREKKEIEEESKNKEIFKSGTRLNHKQREVILLRFQQELSIVEILNILQSPVGTVKSRLYYGLKRLKTIIMKEE